MTRIEELCEGVRTRLEINEDAWWNNSNECDFYINEGASLPHAAEHVAAAEQSPAASSAKGGEKTLTPASEDQNNKDVPTTEMDADDEEEVVEEDDERAYSESVSDPYPGPPNGNGKKVGSASLMHTKLAKPYNQGDLMLRIPEHTGIKAGVKMKIIRKQTKAVYLFTVKVLGSIKLKKPPQPRWWRGI